MTAAAEAGRSRPVAPCAAVIDAPDEARARALLDAILAPHGVEIVRSGAAPYRKLGDHTRIWFWWRLPEGAPADHRARLEALAATLVAPADRERLYTRLEEAEGEGMEFEIVVAANVVTVTAAGLLWLDLEFDLEPAVQADLEAALTS